jgi:dihydrofolate reductase
MSEIIIIVAIAKNGVIGRDGTLPWHLPSDLNHFKKTTMGYPLIMGRKTHDSIGRPLPGRDNIVLTRNKSIEIPGCIKVHTMQAALAHCSGQEKVFIIGGADIFSLALPFTDTIIVTALERDVEGDVYFSEIDPALFKVTEQTRYHEEEPYSILRYERADR